MSKEIQTTQKNHFNAVKKEFGEKAAKMNIREVNSRINKFEKDKSVLVAQNRQLKADIHRLNPAQRLQTDKNRLIGENKKLKKEIRSLSYKKNLTPTEKDILTAKIAQKKANERFIAQKSAALKKVRKPDARTQKIIDQKLKLKKANEAAITKMPIPLKSSKI